jgi:hypothetical protein
MVPARRVKFAQRVQKGAAAAPPVVADQGEVLQEDQQAQHVGIARLRHAEFLLLALRYSASASWTAAKIEPANRLLGRLS